MIESIFRDFGLTTYETKVYLALIEIGEASTGEILNKANIHSGKIYQILNSLKKKGFVSEVIKNGVRKYFPTEPNEIVDFFQEKRKKIDNQEQIFRDILPELNKKIKSAKSKTHIEILTGLQGMKKAFKKEKERYRKGKTLCINGITSYAKHPKKFVDFFQYNMFPIREEAGVIVKKIVDKDAKNNVHEKKAQIKFLTYNSMITLSTISDLVILSVWTEEPLFFVIESEEVARGFKENFNILWKIAKS